jgi:RNAse (barnase) inhibitor barstar
MRIINLHNECRLGDNVFTVHFLNKYYDTDILFNYYIHPQYINELKKHIINENIQIHPYHLVPSDSYSTWIGYNGFYYNKISEYNFKFDLFYVDFFNKMSNELKIEPKFFSNLDMLFDNFNYEISTNKTYDYLIINSRPMSGQFNYEENKFDYLCDLLTNLNKTFITTQKVKNYECTSDYGMSLVDIGNLSNYCNNIISVNTSPIIRTFTIQNIDKVKKRFVLDNYLSYSYNDRISGFTSLAQIYDKL